MATPQLDDLSRDSKAGGTQLPRHEDNQPSAPAAFTAGLLAGRVLGHLLRPTLNGPIPLLLRRIGGR